MTDRPYLEFKDSDTPELRALKSEWQTIMAMPEPERELFLAQGRVQEEERHLDWMIKCNQQNEEFIAHCSQRAKTLVDGYELTGDESALVLAEQYIETGRGTKANKYTIKDIREQREKIQWQRQRTKQIQKQITGLKQSSSHSES